MFGKIKRSNSLNSVGTVSTAPLTASTISPRFQFTRNSNNLTTLFPSIRKDIDKLNNTTVLQPLVDNFLKENISVSDRTNKYKMLSDKIKSMTKNILARDAYLIKTIGFKHFVGICMGESTHNGWAGINPQDQGKFTNRSAYISYSTQKQYFEDIKTQRMDETGNVKSVWQFENQLDEVKKSLGFFFNSNSEESGSIYQKYKGENPAFATKVSNKKKFGIISLLDEFVKYANLNKDIDEEFKRTTDIIFGYQPEDNELGKDILDGIIKDKSHSYQTFKLLLCFSFDRIYPQTIQGTATFSGGGGRPSRQSTQLTIHKSKSQFTRIILYMFSIMCFIYFTFVLFESYRLLNSTIQRVLDARATYLVMYPGQVESPEDASIVAHINAFLKIMYEIGAGTIISTLDRITPEVIDKIKIVFTTTASTAGQQQYDNCADSWFGCINNFLTGQAQARFFADESNKREEQMDIEYARMKYQEKSRITSLKYDFTAGSYNFVTALHGLTFATVLSLHLLFPKVYKKEIAFASSAALVGSYSVNPLYGLYGLGGHLTILFYPSMINKIEDANYPDNQSYGRIEEEERRLRQAIITGTDDRIPLRIKNEAIRKPLLEDAYNADYEDDGDSDTESTFGGKRMKKMRTIKRKMRTLKKQKDKKTKRRFVK
jgi:hypothetical protein